MVLFVGSTAPRAHSIHWFMKFFPPSSPSSTASCLLTSASAHMVPLCVFTAAPPGLALQLTSSGSRWNRGIYEKNTQHVHYVASFFAGYLAAGCALLCSPGVVVVAAAADDQHLEKVQ